MKKTIKKWLKKVRVKIAAIRIESVRHNGREAYVKEGFGLKPIHHFPPYTFFSLYLNGSEAEAFKLYKEWYLDQFNKYRFTEKSVGGMKNGTLFRLIKNEHLNHQIELMDNLENMDQKIFEKSVETRVEQRFALLESIRIFGYQDAGDAIFGEVQNDDSIVLKGGHHRCSILMALGYREVIVGLMRW